jgi:hypothetical protein
MRLSKGIISLITIIVLGTVAGFFIHFSAKHTANVGLTTKKVSTGQRQTTTAISPYTNWKLYCDSATSVCIKYPPNWQAESGFPGSFQDVTGTSVVSLIPAATADETPNTAYIYSVTDLILAQQKLAIVGYIVSNQPGYVVYDATYVSSKDLQPGLTKYIVDGNYAFSSKLGTVSLVATPGPTGYSSIATFDQAKTWFTTIAAQTELSILQSLSYK